MKFLVTPFLVLFFYSYCFAKPYVVAPTWAPDKCTPQDRSGCIIENITGFHPSRIVCEAPKENGEYVTDHEIIDVIDPQVDAEKFINKIKKILGWYDMPQEPYAVVNEDKRQAKILRLEQEKQQALIAQQAREAKKQAFVDECKKVNSKIAKEICDFLLPE